MGCFSSEKLLLPVRQTRVFHTSKGGVLPNSPYHRNAGTRNTTLVHCTLTRHIHIDFRPQRDDGNPEVVVGDKIHFMKISVGIGFFQNPISNLPDYLVSVVCRPCGDFMPVRGKNRFCVIVCFKIRRSGCKNFSNASFISRQTS